MPPELIGAIVLFILTVIGGGTLIVRAASKYIAKKFEVEGEKRAVELENLKRESAENAANSKFVLDTLVTQGKLIAGLQADKESALRLLEESNKTNKLRDEQIGELRALLSRTASERDKERLLRETLEQERNAALEQIKVMEQEIKDLTARVAELENRLKQDPAPGEVTNE